MRQAGPSGETSAAATGEQRIRSLLLERFSSFGFRGRETTLEPARDARRHLWLVDVSRGTGGPAESPRGACISIALLRCGEPVLGVVSAFDWPDDEGELFAWAEGMPAVLRNGRPATRDPDRTPGTVAVAGNPDGRARLTAELAAPHRFRTVPSAALGLALTACGDVAAAVAPLELSAPGSAAGHALLRGAGLVLLDEEGRPVRYTEDGLSTAGAFCVAGPQDVAHALAGRPWQRVHQEPAEPAEPYDLAQPVRARLVSDPALLRRAQGCLLGQLAGDALGSLVEFQSMNAIAQRYPQGVRCMEDGGTFDTIAGQPTDDSEMALILGRSILEQGRFDAEAVARAYCWWRESGPFDIGNTVATALGAGLFAWRSGAASVSEACRRAANPTSEANGALMRVAPLGILGAGAPTDRAAQWADEDAQLTHPNPVCRQANAIFAASLAFAIRNGADARATHEFALSEARRIAAHAKVLAALEAAATARPADYTTNQGHVVLALQNAFYQALHAPSLEEGIADTIGRGGDTDTNAAIAGALLGAIHGRTAIPFQWLDRVLTCRPIRGLAGVRRPRPKAFWPVDALVVAEQLLWLGQNLP
ncbi:MAG: ADP-ribosylglycohydrolase family protein [Bryobacteraceae bacterium]|nr:ADP-ribosylglycohydrolase family protein [Bryobacteraceae bacterium]